MKNPVIMVVSESGLDIIDELKDELSKNEILIKVMSDEDFEKFSKISIDKESEFDYHLYEKETKHLKNTKGLVPSPSQDSPTISTVSIDKEK